MWCFEFNAQQFKSINKQHLLLSQRGLHLKKKLQQLFILTLNEGRAKPINSIRMKFLLPVILFWCCDVKSSWNMRHEKTLKKEHFSNLRSTRSASEANVPTGCFNQRWREILCYRLNFGRKCFFLRLNLIHWLHVKYFNDILHFILYLSPLSTAVYSRLRARDKSLPSQLITWNEGIHHADSRHCKAFTVIYMGEIDWFINTEWTVLCCQGTTVYLA